MHLKKLAIMRAMTPGELVNRLLAMPPRAAMVLRARTVEGRSHDECAALYGLTRSAFDVLFYRSACQLTGPELLLDDAVLAQRASEFALQLDAALAGPEVTVSSGGSDAQLVSQMAALFHQRSDIARGLELAAHAAEQSPQHQYETWLRRIAIVVVVLLTIYFYREQQRRDAQQHQPHLEPRNVPSNAR